MPEAHVDVHQHSRILPRDIREEAASVGVSRERKLYIIRNAQLDADWMQVERSTMDIASRAVESMIRSQGIGDLYRIYATATRNAVEFNLAFIPASFNAPHKEEFDTEYMRALYDIAYNMALRGCRH